jgi:uncharacterized protein DUF3108
LKRMWRPGVRNGGTWAAGGRHRSVRVFAWMAGVSIAVHTVAIFGIRIPGPARFDHPTVLAASIVPASTATKSPVPAVTATPSSARPAAASPAARNRPLSEPGKAVQAPARVKAQRARAPHATARVTGRPAAAADEAPQPTVEHGMEQALAQEQANAARERVAPVPVGSGAPVAPSQADAGAGEAGALTAPPALQRVNAKPDSAGSPSAASLPGHGRIDYIVRHLETGLKLGESSFEWNLDRRHYELSLAARATGLAHLFLPGKRIERSEGAVTPTGLRPDSFRMLGRRHADDVESVRFDWNARRLIFSPGEHSLELPDSTQDILSFLFQFALFPPENGTLHSAITNGRKLDTYFYEPIGEETLDLPLGRVKTRRWSRQHSLVEEGMDVWLAVQDNYLPVKIRYIDKEGRVVEQVATAITAR